MSAVSPPRARRRLRQGRPASASGAVHEGDIGFYGAVPAQTNLAARTVQDRKTSVAIGVDERLLAQFRGDGTDKRVLLGARENGARNRMGREHHGCQRSLTAMMELKPVLALLVSFFSR